MSHDGTVPDWRLDALRALFGHIARSISALFPDLGPNNPDLMVRALFSAMH
ncbi:MAG: hypothetical protein H5U18_14470 [Rhodobacteraceae bacterium]|nr:hypothetical protein [Paracoccaceae bacterium]